MLLKITVSFWFLSGSIALASPDIPSVPAMMQIPAQGALGRDYLVNLFLQVCSANKSNLENVTRLALAPGWTGSFIGTRPIYKISSGRDNWPTIEISNSSDVSNCSVSWTIDPNQGVGSVQALIEHKTGVKLDGNRITTNSDHTVFVGFGDYDQQGVPHLFLNEDISPKRATFQIMLDGKGTIMRR